MVPHCGQGPRHLRQALDAGRPSFGDEYCCVRCGERVDGELPQAWRAVEQHDVPRIEHALQSRAQPVLPTEILVLLSAGQSQLGGHNVESGPSHPRWQDGLGDDTHWDLTGLRVDGQDIVESKRRTILDPDVAAGIRLRIGVDQ